MNFFTELKRRNVFRVGVVYVIATWLILQVVDIVFPGLGLPGWTITFVIALLAIGVPVAVILAWAFEITPEGIKKEKDVDHHLQNEPRGNDINHRHAEHVAAFEFCEDVAHGLRPLLC